MFSMLSTNVFHSIEPRIENTFSSCLRDSLERRNNLSIEILLFHRCFRWSVDLATSPHTRCLRQCPALRPTLRIRTDPGPEGVSPHRLLWPKDRHPSSRSPGSLSPSPPDLRLQGCWDPWEGLELEAASPDCDCGWSRCEDELNALHGVKPSGEDMAVHLTHRPQSSSRADAVGWILISHESDEGRRREAFQAFGSRMAKIRGEWSDETQ